MSKIKNRIGLKYNRLTVINRATNDKYGTRWLCLCDCGNEKIVKTTHLVSGCVKSCGCAQRSDLSNKKFNRLTILSFDHVHKRNKTHYDVYWNCICDCGNIVQIRADHLVSNRIKSCGCLQSELSRERLSLVNTKKGIENHNYNHSLSDGERNIKRTKTYEYRIWRNSVYKRDNYKCQICGVNINKLNAHHIESWDKNKEKRYDINNAITLCKSCHIEFHNEYGRGNNNEKQLTEFRINFDLSR